ncbi:hypothetical protein ACEPAF_1660 [Sanghuangporus sanghuang]
MSGQADGHYESIEDRAHSSWRRFEQSGNRGDLDLTIKLEQHILDNCPHGHPNRWSSLRDLSISLHSRYDGWREKTDLDKAISLQRDALDLRPEDPKSLSNLANSLLTRFEEYGMERDLDDSIQLHRDLLAQQTDDDPSRTSSMNDLANSLLTRFEKYGNNDDLNESIALHRAALDLRLEDHPFRASSLSNLSNCLRTRFQRTGSTKDLDESITMNREALDLRSEGHPDRSISLNNTANSVLLRFNYFGKVDDLDEAIVLYRASLALRHEGHPLRPSSLSNLANSLRIRFEESGRAADLDESIELARAALALRPDGHHDRLASLVNLSGAVLTRFRRGGRREDLDESIALNRAAMVLQPDSHPGRFMTANNLASSLLTRFDQDGRQDDLDESISLHRASLTHLSDEHPDRSILVNNLANSLSARFQHEGRPEDLDESIALSRIALSLRPGSHPHRPASLNNLASSLLTRFEQDGKVDDLDESIALQRDGLTLQPKLNPERSKPMNNLASSLISRFQQKGVAKDLEESIALDRAALSLLPENHPDRTMSMINLANSLAVRFKDANKAEDLDESIALLHTSLELCLDGHPRRSIALVCLANSLYLRSKSGENGEDLENSTRALENAANHTPSSLFTRLKAAQRWLVLARMYDHRTTLNAYRSATSLLQHILSIRPNLSSQHILLRSSHRYQPLTLDAASFAINKGNFTEAIELLEQGRALLWSQLHGVRMPLDQLSERDKALADRFRDCSRRLEAFMTSMEPHIPHTNINESSTMPDKPSVDEVLLRIRRLLEEQEAIVARIRHLPGFENFLGVVPFEVLQEAASEGPIIVINHCEFRSDALIVLSRKESPCVCVPLDKGWYLEAFDLCNELLRVRRDRGVYSAKYDESLRRVMKVVWDRVVSNVVGKLKELGINEGRIWWCLTSVLPALPFHAAGPYESPGGRMKYLMDDYISSYTPSLKSLINARTGAQCGSHRLLFVGDTKLPAASKERDIIRRYKNIDKFLLDDRATPDSVLKWLQKVQWVHFACHGILKREPFASSLKLRGGRLTLLDIARLQLPNAEFAFLSACHTAEQGPTFALDESLHLAAAIQFCGFRSVVGTMWQLLDRDGPFLAGVVYAQMMAQLGDDEFRFKKAAAAVREAALRLRDRKDEGPDGYKTDMMVERWVNLVHIGA